LKQPGSQRITFIDVARTYAVFLALLSHGFLATGMFRQLDENSVYIRQFTRMATPMFLFMFGFMIEYVYVRRARNQGLDSIRKRLMVRSFQCYLGYALTSLSALIVGYKSLAGFIGSLVLFSDSRFGNALRIYAILLLLAPVVIRLRLKYGRLFVMAALLFVTLSSLFLVQTKGYTFGVFDRPLNALFGIGARPGGPSVWHSMCFMLAGMFVASGLPSGPDRRLFGFFRSSSVMLTVSIALGVVFIHEKPGSALRMFAGAGYRSDNRIEFIIIGIFCSVMMMMIFGAVFGSRPPPRLLKLFLPVGQASLFAFTLGNILLNFTLTIARQWPPAVYLSIFFCCVLFLTRTRERLPYYTLIHDMLNGGFKGHSFPGTPGNRNHESLNCPPAARPFFSLKIKPWGLVTAAGVIASMATLFGFLGRFAWFFDLLSHFRVQYLLGLAVIGCMLLAGRRFRSAAVHFGFALINLSLVVPLYLKRAPNPNESIPAIRAMLVNVNTRHGDPRRVHRVVDAENPDILVLEEISARWISDLAWLEDVYPHARTEPREDNFGIGLYSRYPFADSEIVAIGSTGVPTILATIETNQGAIRVIATHPVPPGNRMYTRWRDEHLELLPKYIQSPLPVLLLGDLNVTPWNRRFRRLLAYSGLLDSARGFGVQPTWPSYNPLLRIPIDHCLHSPGIIIRDRWTGENVASDHYPLIVDFTIANLPN